MLLRIIPLESSHDTTGLTYTVSHELEPDIRIGQMVYIPLRKELSLGIIAEISNTSISEIPSDIKPIISLVSRLPVLAPEQIRVIDDIATRNLIHIHKVASLFLPRPLQKRIEKYSLADTSDTTYLSAITPIPRSSNTPRPVLHYVREEVLFDTVRTSLECDDSIIIVPSDRYLSPDSQSIPGTLKFDATDTIRSKFWLSLQKKEFLQAIWTRRLVSYNLSAYSRIIYIEDSLLPEIYHSFHTYSGLDILLSLVHYSGQELHIISRTPLIHTGALAMSGAIDLVQYPWNHSSPI